MMYNLRTKYHFHRSNFSYSCHCRCYRSVRTVLLPGPPPSSRAPTRSTDHHLQVGTQITNDGLVQHLAPIHILDSRISITTDKLPDRVNPTGSETKYHVFNNQITDNVNIYHSEATTLIPKACSMKYTQNIRAHTLIRDYHIGILVIARSINPRPHYQARER